MPELPHEVYEDKLPPSVRNGTGPWWSRFIPIVWTTIWTNPMNFAGLVAIGVLVWQVTQSNREMLQAQRDLADQITARYDTMETRREAREEKTSVRMETRLEKLATSLDLNTDALRLRGKSVP